ncbi:MAG: hypothetical protein ABSB90_05660 [Thermoplasmata archaeon]|jgi:hypothetical protein
MAEGNGDWLRARGIGRERFAGYVGDYLVSVGYTVERAEGTEPVETRITCRLQKMNPALPPAANALEFRLYPTSGGAALVWEAPREVPEDQRSRMDRFVREIEGHLTRAVATESHATAKVVRPTDPHLPWTGNGHAGPA